MKRKTRNRLIAFVLALAMVVSVVVPKVGSTGILRSFADGGTVKEITVNDNQLSVNIYINNQAATNPDIVYEGDKLSLYLSFNVPANELSSGTTFVYDIPDNIKYTGDNTTGDIVVSKSSTELYNVAQVAGTYDINKTEGKVYFYITNPEVYKFNTDNGRGDGVNGIPIPIDFNCNAEAELGNDASGKRFDIPGYTNPIYLYPNKDVMGMNVSKSNSPAPDADGNITYTIDVVVPDDKRCSYSTIDITDDFLKYDKRAILSFVDGSLSITKTSNGATSAVDSGSYTFSGVEDVSEGSVTNGEFKITGLPQLQSGEKYTITYKLHNDLESGDKYAYNKVKAESKILDRDDGQDKNEVTAYSQIGLSMMRTSKNGTFNSETGKIDYTITFNGPHQDIKDVTFKDIIDFPDSEYTNNSKDLSEILSRLEFTSIQTIDENGNDITGTLITSDNFKNLFVNDKNAEGGITSSISDKNTYILKYSYKPVNLISTSELKFNNLSYVDEENKDDGNVSIGPINPQNKGTQSQRVEGGDVIFTWNLSIKNDINRSSSDENTVPDGSFTIDTFENGHYIDMALNVTNTYINSITYQDSSGNYVSSFDDAKDENGKVYGVKFTYNEIPKDTSFNFTYETKAALADITPNQQQAFVNTAVYTFKLNDQDITDTDTATHYYTKTTSVYKYVLSEKDNTYNRTENPDQKTYSDSDNIIYYEIYVPYMENPAGDMIVTDTLPEGVTIKESSVYSTTNGQDKPGDYDISELVTESSNGNQLTYTIKPEAFKYIQYNTYNRGVMILYSVQLPSTKPEAANEQGIASFTNTVTFNGDSDSVTQNVKYEDSTGPSSDVLSKVNLDSDDIVSSQDVERTFRVIINPDGADLDPSKDIIILNDKAVFKTSQINSVSIKEIHLYDYSDTATDNKGAVRDASMSFTDNTDVNSNNLTYSFSLTIPDSTAYVLEYTYQLNKTGLSDSGSITYSNEVDINGQNKQSSNYSFSVSDSSASSTVKNPEITLFKTDKNNYNIKLSGATFELKKAVADGDDYNFETVISAFSVPANGLAILSLGKTSGENESYDSAQNKLTIKPDTVYQLTEKTPPEGYKTNSDPIYFAVGSDETLKTLADNEAVKNVVDKKGISNKTRYFVTNGVINFGDEENDASNKVSIKKKWLDGDGNELSGTALNGHSVEVELHKVSVSPSNGGHTVTFRCVSYGDSIQSYNQLTTFQSYYVKDNGDFSARIVFSNNQPLTNGYYTINDVVYPSSNIKVIDYKYVIDIDLKNINKDYTYEFYNGNWSVIQSINNADYDVADLTIGTDTLVGTYTLNGNNDFSKNIPVEALDTNYHSYLYYIKEKSATPSADYTITYTAVNSNGIVYSDTNNKYVSSNGTLTVSNKDTETIDTGSFKIKKQIAENGSTENVSATVKKKLAGTYTFGVFTDSTCSTPYSKNSQPVTVSITIGEDGAAVTSSEVTDVPTGDYWLKETTPTNGSAPTENPVKITVEKGKTGDQAVVATFTNNINTTDVVVTKSFSGIDSLPEDFAITNTYDRTLEFKPSNADNASETTAGSPDNPYKWTIHNVPIGTQITFTETGFADENYTLVANGDNADNATSIVQSIQSVSNDTHSVAFTNVYTRKTGDLSVTKLIYKGDSNVTSSYSTYKFGFTISVPDTSASETYKLTRYIRDAASAPEDIHFTEGGLYNIEISAGETIKIEGLPYGADYAITENNSMPTVDGGTFSQKTSACTGVSGEISNNSAATFVNEFIDDELGSITVKKNFGTGNENTTKGTFHVTLKSGDDYYKADGTPSERAVEVAVPVGTTGVTFNNLPLNKTYTVSEVKLGTYTAEIAGYTLSTVVTYGNDDSANPVALTSTNKDITVQVTNTYTRDTGSFKIKKQIAENGSTENVSATVKKKLAGTYTFGVFTDSTCSTPYSKNSQPVTVSITIGEDGAAVTSSEVTDVPTGDYWLKETTPTNGSAPTENPVKITVEKGKTGDQAVVATFTNNINTTDVYVSKRDITSGEELADAVITIYEGDVSNETNPSVDKQIESWTSEKDTTDKEGHKISGLEYGKVYTLRENTAPAGYDVTADTVFRVKEDGSIELISTGTVDNSTGKEVIVIEDKLKTRDVLVDKRDIVSGEELKDAVITVYAGDVSSVENPSDNLKLDNWTSSDEAPHTIHGLEYGKTYTLRENTAPAGYDVTADTVFRIELDGTIRILGTGTVDNTTGKEIIVINDRKLNEAVFKKYGWVNEECSESSEEDYKYQKKPLAGVEFTLYDSEGKQFGQSVLSDAEGVVKFTGLPTGAATFTFKETAVPDGYILSDDEYKLTITSTGEIQITDADGKEITEIVNDLYRTDIVLKKVSEKDNDVTLPKSRYGLFRKVSKSSGSGSASGTGGYEVLIATAETDRDGMLRFKGVVAGRRYVIREIAAPDGYYVSESPITIDIVTEGASGTSQGTKKVVVKAVDMGTGFGNAATAYIDPDTGEITWLEPEIECSVLKVDENGKILEGASLEIRAGSEDGSKIASWTSSTKAYNVEAELLKCGNVYYLVETKAPEGYEIAKAVRFEIPEEMGAGESKPIEVMMTDKKVETTTEKTETTTETTETVTEKTTVETTTETSTITTEVTTETSTATIITTETATESTDTVVKTSDETPFGNLLLMQFLALVGMAIFAYKKKKNNEQ